MEVQIRIREVPVPRGSTVYASVNNRFLRKRQHTRHGNITFIKMSPGKFEETKVASTVLKSLNLTFRKAWANVRSASL